jgi:hypothetical protein
MRRLVYFAVVVALAGCGKQPSGVEFQGEQREMAAPNAHEYASYWSHNGSVLGLRVEGNNRAFAFVEPRDGLPVKPGTVLFSGISDGSAYKGKARRFSAAGEPIEYEVEGPIQNNFSRVTLHSQNVERDANGSIKKGFDEILVFDLIRRK